MNRETSNVKMSEHVFLFEDEPVFQVPDGMSLAEASSGMVSLRSSELIQEIAMDPALEEVIAEVLKE